MYILQHHAGRPYKSSVLISTTCAVCFYSTRIRAEQSLVRWATPQLHDIDALAKMVDPALKGIYPAKSLSRFADIIALCVQVFLNLGVVHQFPLVVSKFACMFYYTNSSFIISNCEHFVEPCAART